MSILLKKITSAVSAATIAFVAVAPSITNAASGFAPYAEALAKAKIITTQSNEAGYRLADSAMRQEVAAMMIALNKADTSAATCTGKFSDVSATKPNSWVCKVVETALAKGLIAANATFRPEANITRAEALAMILKGQGVEIATGAAASFNDTPIAWQKDVANTALSKKIISANASFRPNASVTRGELFVMAANAAGLEIASASDDLNLDDLFGDDTATGTTSTGTTDTPVVVKAGDLNVALAASTPAATTIPANVSGIIVAKFDLTAGSNDISVNSIKLKRVGLGNTDTLSALALSTADGRISKSKNENSSDDTVDFALSSALVVKAGSTITVNVLASVPAIATNAGGDEFAIQLLSVGSSAANVNMGSVVGNTMKVGWVDAAGLTVADDGTTATVKVGETNKEVYKFKITNGSNDEDMTLSSITLKETGTVDDMIEIANWKLYMDGTEVATTAKSSDKYVTFNLATAATLKASKIVKFVVKADIIGGAGKNVLLSLDSTLDVTAQGTKYGYWVGVTDSSDGAAVSIDAWELVLGAIDATNATIKEDKNDVILGKIKVTSNAGKNLELQKFKVTVTNSYNDDNYGWDGITRTPDTYLENVELYDETNGVVYDLTRTAVDTNSDYYADADLNIALPSTGSVTFAIRADTKNLSGNSLITFASSRFTPAVSLAAPNVGFYVVETEDDTAVTDITPSSMSFKVLEGSTATATTSLIPLSASKTAVIGSVDVEALTFEVKADDSSTLKMTEAKVSGTPGTDTLDNTRVTELKLYKDSISEANLLDRVSGSQISTEVATFDGFNVEIAKNNTQKFIVTMSIADDNTMANDVLKLALLDLSLDDEDNDDVDANLDADSDITTSAVAAGYTSARAVTISGVGTLTATVDNTDSSTSNDKTVLANATSDFVASWEMVATNEAVKVKDLTLTADETGESTAFESAVSTVILYANDKTTEIARKSVTSNVTTFSDVNYVVAEGSSNIYAKVITRKIGRDEAGLLAANGYELELTVTDADGNASSKAVDVSAIDAIADAAVAPSNTFLVAPTRISNVAFVSSYGSETVTSKLTNGQNTVAILAVTTDSATNTDGTNGSTLKSVLRQLNFTLTSDATVADNSTVVTRVNGPGTDDDYATTHVGAAAATVTTDLTTVTSVNNEVDNGSVAYYAIKVTVSGLTDATAKYVQVELGNLDDGTTVTYSSNDSWLTDTADTTYLVGGDDAAEITAATFSALNLSFDKLTATKVSQ